ncbi:uncharacterized protein LOC115215518 [Octopus sinensis]|uniref:Uncharacterized protein LOC115215518 n=1 Tax=Octopus sinensis TaxID=2607531 RepID=A0A6P7SRI9_9MOLL|nr:uncharacterized protein LOC115215518 [Octopus sinensis]
MKKVSVPRSATLGELENVNLNDCNEACNQYLGCNSFQYNEQDKLCELTNATQLNNELKPNDGSWDIYIVSPVVTKVNCGAPKDVVGASKSYDTTNYESEVIYTCQDEEELKATCKENKKWAPEVSCKVSKINFVKVKGAILDVPGKTMLNKKNVTAEACAEKCLSDKTCLSFEITKRSGNCYLSKATAASTTELKTAKDRDYYQQIKPDDDVLTFKKTAIPGHDTFDQIGGISLKECDHACLQIPGCKSYEYHEANKSCIPSNETLLTYDLKPNKDGWDIYIMNPVYSNVSCETPKDIAHTSKSYNSTNYRSEVTYTCPGGEKFKSICGKDNKWTPMISLCKDFKNQFVEVNDSLLDVPAKKLWKKKNVTAEACAKKCFSDKKCLSFEISKRSGKCFLSKNTAATSNKLKAAKTRNYYQRIKPDDTKIELPKVSIPGQDIFKELKNVNLKKCDEACLQHSECNSYEYNEERKACNLSEVTHLTDKLEPNDGTSDTYIIDPDYSKINCGPPKDIVGAEKSYNATTYKSEVIYTCPGDELKSICKKDNKWTPVNSTCKAYAKINCGAPKEVVGATKSYKTITFQSEVTYTCPKGEQLKSVCEKNNKWTPVAEACKVSQINFVKVKDATLDVSGKILWKEKNVTADACAEGCLSNENCLSFEINKNDGKCYFSRQTAATNKKMKTTKSRDYYQRVKSDKPVMIKKVSMPSKTILGQLKNKTLKECEKTCQHYIGCNSYQYNAEAKLCDLSNVTQLSDDVLKPNDGDWDIFLVNPVNSKVDCGPPKDINGAKKTYNTTTFKSEVTYTCPEGEKFKSVCKEDHKWSPVPSTCKAAQIHFVKVKYAVLDVSGKPLLHKKNITTDACAKECLSDKTCLSFEMNKENGDCYLSKQTATKSKKMKSDKSRDYYQRIKSDKPVMLKKASLPSKATLGRLKNKTLKECDKACHHYIGCNSYQYNAEAKLCDLSNVTQLNNVLKPVNGNWDIYLLNPAYKKVNCGRPKRVVGAKKSYKATTFKSEVTYTCPEGEIFKSVCKEDQKWSPVPSACEAAKINFVKVKDAVLDVSGKTLLQKKNVTADACAKECLSDESCLSFEITKESGGCYLSRKIATSSKKMKSSKSRDYYQRIKSKDDVLILKSAAIPGHDTFGRVDNVSLKECDHACHQNPGCNSYEYNEKLKLCDQSNVTHLTQDLLPNTWEWNTYIINPVNSKINCGPPKDIVGAEKDYKSTDYKSEVTYTCPDEESFKSTCEKNNKWTPVPPICNVYSKINCGPPKDIVGAEKSYNTTTYKSEVIYTCPEGDKLKSICKKDRKWAPVHSACKAYAKINCGTPKEVAGASKSYKTTTFRSEVTYTCPKGEQLKSVCEKNNKWTPVAEACKVSQINFVKVKDATLDVSGKRLWKKKSVTADACAKKCLSDKNCLSFEMKKKNGKCYLSKKTAATTNKIKTSKSRDYYQRVKSNKPVMFKKVSMPSKAILGQLKGKTLKQCDKACHHYIGCNSYQFNAESKLCDLSNVTHLTDVFKPTDGNWNIYLVNPVNSKVDCGPPKDVISANKSYKTTTFKSKVTYTCPEGEKLQSVCKENHKWSPVPSTCEVARINFVKVKDAVLDVSGKILLQKKNMTADACGKECLSDETCLSFEINKRNKECYLSKKTATKSKKMKSDKSRDYYQRTKSKDDVLVLKSTSIPGHDSFERVDNVSLKECDHACHQNPGCNSYEYNEKLKLCDQSNVTHLTQDLLPNTWEWNTYIINPVNSKINCGPPKDIVGAEKDYKSTDYKSEVTYSCPADETIKSICEKNNKWTPVPPICKDTKNQFVKVKDASLDVPEKKLLRSNKMTAETCIVNCLPDKNCLSFEITKSGKCYLSKKTAATSKKLKAAPDSDYYQRIQPNEKQIMLRDVSIPGTNILGLHKKMDLKKCNESCQQNPECHSYQYNEKDKICKLRKATHLTHELKISKGIWDTYFLNTDYTDINCGPPNDVTGSVKSYNSTTYKSEVTYTCPEGEKLKSVCEKDNKWTPVASVCKAYANINCGNPKDVVNALKSYETTTYKSEVTYTCPKGEKLKSTCEKDSKWTPVASACKDIEIHFMKIKNAVLDEVGKIILSGKNMTKDDCAERCLSHKSCLSFEITKKGGKCYISKQTAASSKKIKIAEDRDYYQRVKSIGEPVTIKKVNLQKKDIFGRVKNKTLKECNKTCQEYSGCNSFQYNEKAKLCDLSGVTQLTDKLEPNDGSWDIFMVNPTFLQVDCGSPKNVTNAEKSYKTTTYKSEVTYTCPGGEKFKATCKDNNKWDPVIPSCSAAQIHFVKVTDAILDVTGKTLADKKNVTADTCAEKCLSYKTCLSFEMNKQSGKCYLSKESTATSKKIKATKSRDYYQRINSDDELLTFKRTAIPGQDTFGRLKNIELKECHHICHQNPGCKSYEYNERTKTCDQSNATHLTQNLQPNKWGWDTYIINPASPTAEVNCGPPKDIADASKSYKATTYKSEVTYTCPLGEKLVSVCENSSKWSSVETPCEDIQNHFATVKEAILDVKGKYCGIRKM